MFLGIVQNVLRSWAEDHLQATLWATKGRKVLAGRCHPSDSRRARVPPTASLQAGDIRMAHLSGPG
jgi:hypothetical protein